MKRPRLQPLQFGQELCRSEITPGGVPMMQPRTLRLTSEHALSLTSIASRLAPTGIGGVCTVVITPAIQCGSEPARDSGLTEISMLTVMTSSRASPLSQGLWPAVGLAVTEDQNGGSGLARESGGSVDTSVECAGLFASKPAPTVLSHNGWPWRRVRGCFGELGNC